MRLGLLRFCAEQLEEREAVVVRVFEHLLALCAVGNDVGEARCESTDLILDGILVDGDVVLELVWDAGVSRRVERRPRYGGLEGVVRGDPTVDRRGHLREGPSSHLVGKDALDEGDAEDGLNGQFGTAENSAVVDQGLEQADPLDVFRELIE